MPHWRFFGYFTTNKEMKVIFFESIPKYIGSQREVSSMEDGYYYVFEKRIVFCKWRKIFAVDHFRIKARSVVSSFEEVFPSLEYSCILGLAGEDLKTIRWAFQKSHRILSLRVLWGLAVNYHLRSVR